ncbi:Glucosamine-6-phosphate isomerase (Glucosamine-6-phosphate deaminase) (GNPDA) (GlcN6P deaminase) [Coemansia linderi]|uniref:Glucosamine-6-phosphate isomerase (Glucosamine-6-phosphate deaminase) (GNPDA) (GlcN6P deaminase) n=1 Tax=Coemansia linderi TaxID=2663919 RepID=A0ACC1KMR6_9FUNG|nr:Glucosamine-6-phosphate isomerase (Glucosamine-6-phosphate deaminase) (GNPDA) (GlcN6P deaminase) [Coemansia linderi]
MRLIIRDDPKAVAYYTANYVRQRINEFKPTRKRPFVLGLPTGSTPVEVYWHLVDYYKRGEVSFRHVITFSMDEYVGLPRSHPESYCAFMRRHLYDHINLRPENIHMLDGNADDLAAECQRYEDKIKEVGGIELFLGGIGPDGHIAFNEPGSSLESVTRVKTLAYETVLANARFFGGDVNKVPKLALTVGVGTVRAAREVLLIITGAHKAVALAKCIEEGVNHMWTVSVVQLHPSAMIVCDEDATLELHVKTVRYFKSIEQVQEQLIGRQNIGLKGSISKLANSDPAGTFGSGVLPPVATTANRDSSASDGSQPSADEDSGDDGDDVSSQQYSDNEDNDGDTTAAAAPAALSPAPANLLADSSSDSHGRAHSSHSPSPKSAPKLPKPSSNFEASSQPTSLHDSGDDDDDDEDMVVSDPSRDRSYATNAATEHYPRYMLPRASGMSTMGEIHALGPSPPTRSPADSTANLAGYDQASVYPATWHEYEDQFNYFYNCHFIEQDYYDYLAGTSYRPISYGEEDAGEDDGNGDFMETYSDENANSDVANIDALMGDVDAAQPMSEIPPTASLATTEAELSDVADPDSA